MFTNVIVHLRKIDGYFKFTIAIFKRLKFLGVF